jgi:hypothetical protein
LQYFINKKIFIKSEVNHHPIVDDRNKYQIYQFNIIDPHRVPSLERIVGTAESILGKGLQYNFMALFFLFYSWSYFN